MSAACTTNPIPAIYKPNPGDRNKRFIVCVHVELTFDGAEQSPGLGLYARFVLSLRL